MTSADMPAPLADEPATVRMHSKPSEWTETVLTVLFTASAILFVSFIAVVTGLI